MDFGTITSVASAAISVVAAFISWRNLNEYCRIEMLRINFDLLTKAEELLLENPEFLELHSVKEDDLKSCGVTHKEFVYILSSMRAGQAFFKVKNQDNI